MQVPYTEHVKQTRQQVFEARINLLVGQLASLHDLLRDSETMKVCNGREEWLRFSESSVQNLASNLTHLFRVKDGE